VLGKISSKDKKELWISGSFSDLATKTINELGFARHVDGKIETGEPVLSFYSFLKIIYLN